MYYVCGVNFILSSTLNTSFVGILISCTQRDTELLLTVATFLESLPALSISNKPNIDSNKSKQSRLINTQLVSATQEFMSRVFEELDYRNEAKNCLEFANLYSRNGGNSTDVSVVVPKVYMNWCTENVLGECLNRHDHYHHQALIL